MKSCMCQYVCMCLCVLGAGEVRQTAIKLLLLYIRTDYYAMTEFSLFFLKNSKTNLKNIEKKIALFIILKNYKKFKKSLKKLKRVKKKLFFNIH